MGRAVSRPPALVEQAPRTHARQSRAGGAWAPAHNRQSLAPVGSQQEAITPLYMCRYVRLSLRTSRLRMCGVRIAPSEAFAPDSSVGVNERKSWVGDVSSARDGIREWATLRLRLRSPRTVSSPHGSLGTSPSQVWDCFHQGGSPRDLQTGSNSAHHAATQRPNASFPPKVPPGRHPLH